MLNLLQININLLLIYITTIPLGYLISKHVTKTVFDLPIILRIIIYSSLGVVSSIPILFIISMYKISSLNIILIFILPLLVEIINNRNKINFECITTKFNIITDNRFELIIFLVLYIYFLNIINFMKWPPAGDVITAYGPMVSVLKYYMKLPLNREVIKIFYPPGYAVFTANINFLSDLYPAEMIFIFGTFIVINLCLLIYSQIYIITKSKFMSLIGVLMIVEIPKSGKMVNWIIGYLFNGTYASLLGVFIFVLYIIFNQFIYLNRDVNKLFSQFIVDFIFLISLIITYPPFAIIIMIYLFLIYSRFYFSKKNFKNLILISALIIAMIFVLYNYENEKINLLISYFKGSYFPGGIGIGGSETRDSSMTSILNVLDSFSMLISIIAFPLSVINVIKHKKLDINLLYSIIFLLLLMSNITYFYEYLLYIQPKKTIIFLSLLSYSIISYTINNSDKLVNVKIFQVTKQLNSKFILTLMILIIFLLFNTNSLMGYSSINKIKTWSWFSKTGSFNDDLMALEWISKNVESKDLILNDMSYNSMSLWSLSIHNVTHNLWMKNVMEKRFNDIQHIWFNPYDMDNMKEKINTYDIKYVLVTSEWGYQMYGDPSWYESKPYTPIEYITIFNSYHFLSTVFTSGNTRVYKVIRNNYNLNEIFSYNLSDYSSKQFWSSGSWNVNGEIGDPILSDNSLNIYIPKGNNTCFGLYHKENNINLSNITYIKIEIESNKKIGLTLKIWDKNGNNALYNFRINENITNNIYINTLLPVEYSSELDIKSIKGFSITTGFNKPLPQFDTLLKIINISFYNMIKIVN